MKTKIKTDYGIFSLLPCPFCGNPDLYIGHRESDVMEIRCWWNGENNEIYGCGASIGRHLFPDDELDEKGRTTLNPPKNAYKKKWFHKRALRKAEKQWNNRMELD